MHPRVCEYDLKRDLSEANYVGLYENDLLNEGFFFMIVIFSECEEYSYFVFELFRPS